MKKKIYGIIVFILTMLFIPNVNAYIETKLKYNTTGEDVDVNVIYGLGWALDNFLFNKTHSYDNNDFSYINKKKLEANDNKLKLEFTHGQLKYGDEVEEAVSASSNWNVKVYFTDDKTNEYVVYEGNITGQQFLDGTSITLDLSNVPTNDNYNLFIEITDGEEVLDTGADCYDNYCGYYDEFMIGDKYGFDFEAKIDDTYGLSERGNGVNLLNYFDSFDSFTYSYRLYSKEDGDTYNIELYHCTLENEEDDYYSGDADDNDTCTLVAREENVSVGKKYFETVVTKEDYNSTYKDIDYLKFKIFNGDDAIVNHYYYLWHEYVAQTEFIKYTITDKTGHDVRSDNISHSKNVTIHFDGINFIDDETYYVGIEVSPANEEDYDEEYDWRDEYKPYTGKQLNEGIDIDVNFELSKDRMYMGVYSTCSIDDENETCDYETSYYLEMSHTSDKITIIDNVEQIKTLSVKNLRAIGINYNKVQLDFDDVEGADGYAIYRSTKKSSGYKLIGTSETSEYIDNNASVAKTYYYKVRAYNDSTGSKIYSKYSSVKSAKAKLLNPTVTVKDSSYNSIKVSYDKVEGATGYQIYRATSKNGKYSLVKTTTSLSYTDKKLTTGKTYYYKVRAYRTISGKKYYSSYSTIQSDKPAVVAPGVTVASYDYNINKITISSKPAGATGYSIYRSDSADGTYSFLGTTTKTTYYDKNLETGKTYYYKVRAYRTVSKSKKYGYYTEVMESTPTLRTPNVSIVNTSRNSLTLNIDKVNGADGYYIYEVINGVDTLLGYTEETTVTYNDLTLGSEHVYKVIAAKVNESEHLSLEKIVTETVKPAAINLTINVDSFHTQTLTSTLSEVEETDEVILYLYSSTSKDGEYTLVYEGSPTISETGEYLLSATINNLRLNSTYYYKAQISINGVMSSESEIVYKKAVTTPDITVLNYEYNKIIIGTTADAEMDGFQVYRATSKNGKYTKVYDGTDNVTILKETFNKKYYYKIRYYKVYDGKKVYSPFSKVENLKTGVKALDEYPLTLTGNFGSVKIKSVSLTYKKTNSSYVTYTFKLNYSKTYASKKTTVYYTVKFLDWRTNQVYTYTLYDDVPKGTKRNWSSTFTIKVPKTAVYYYFE